MVNDVMCSALLFIPNALLDKHPGLEVQSSADRKVWVPCVLVKRETKETDDGGESEAGEDTGTGVDG